MIQNSLTGESLIALAARRRRQQTAILLIGSLIDAPVAGWSLLAFNRFQTGRPINWIEVIGIGSLATITNIAGIYFLWRNRPPPGIFKGQTLIAQLDRLQRRREYLMVLAPIVALLYAPIVWWATIAILGGTNSPAALIAIMSGLSIMGVYLGVLTGHSYSKDVRGAFDDEVSRAYRAKALQAGFYAAMAGSLALYLLGLYRPAFAVAGLPVVWINAVGVACLRLAVLEQRADRDA